MTCLSEFTCAVYADGELPDSEARGVAQHLAACGTCRRSVEALRVESRALVQCFQDIDFIEFELEDEALSAPQASKLSLARFTMFVLAMATLLRPVASAFAELELPESLNWLNPMSAAGQVNLLFNGVVYGIPAALKMIDSFLKTATLIVFGTIVLAGILMLFRRFALGSALLSVIALLTVFSSSGYAIEVRRGDQPVTVPTGETINDTLVVVGDSVTVDGTVNGDLIALVEHVRIRGTVKGNLVSFAERIEIEGAVEGSVLGAGGWVETRGQIGQNLYAAAGNVSVGKTGRIGGNATFLAGESTLEGAVEKDLTAYSARSTGWGPFHLSVGWGPFRLSDRGGVFHVLAPARVGRNLSVKVDRQENVRIDSGVMIGGKTDIQVPPVQPSKYSTASFYIWQTIWLAAALITGMLAFWLVPAFGRINLESSRALLTAAGVGFLALVATPIAAVLTLITLIGLPLGLITLAAWAVAGYLAKIVIAGFLGRSLLASQGDSTPTTALVLLAGLAPIFVAINLPYVGALINFLLVLPGLGALVITTYQMPRWRAPLLDGL